MAIKHVMINTNTKAKSYYRRLHVLITSFASVSQQYVCKEREWGKEGKAVVGVYGSSPLFELLSSGATGWRAHEQACVRSNAI